LNLWMGLSCYSMLINSYLLPYVVLYETLGYYIVCKSIGTDSDGPSSGGSLVGGMTKHVHTDTLICNDIAVTLDSRQRLLIIIVNDKSRRSAKLCGIFAG
jgi:hypothetical protein